MIGFYLLAIGMAAVLLYIPWAIAEHANRIPAKVLMFCAGGALVILWSIVPRPDRFEPPGPVLAPDRQRRLFGLIGEVATTTGQAMPREVTSFRTSTRGSRCAVGSWASAAGR